MSTAICEPEYLEEDATADRDLENLREGPNAADYKCKNLGCEFLNKAFRRHNWEDPTCDGCDHVMEVAY